MTDQENIAQRHRFGDGGPSALFPARVVAILSLLLLVVVAVFGRGA